MLRTLFCEQIEFRSNPELEAIEWRYVNYDWQVLCPFDELTGVDLDKIEETMLSLQEAVQDDRRLTEEARNQSQVIKQYLDSLEQTVINDTTVSVQRAEAASQNVDAKESTVLQKHDEVLDTALNVQSDKDLTQAAKNAAELARDAAIAAAGPLYATIEEGRAAVADGESFAVQGGGDIAAYQYRRLSASSSILLATYPSGRIAEAMNSGGNLSAPACRCDKFLVTCSRGRVYARSGGWCDSPYAGRCNNLGGLYSGNSSLNVLSSFSKGAEPCRLSHASLHRGGCSTLV